MKTTNTLRLLAAALLLTAAATTRADYTSLTVKETAGTWTSFGLKGLKVTFSADNITVANTEMKQTYPIGDVWSLQLTDLPTGINGATTDGQSSDFIVSTDRGRISVTAQPGTPVRVYSATGQLCATLNIDGGTPAAIGNLAPGIYIVRAGNQTQKLVIK
jgi:hypothetical protein